MPGPPHHSDAVRDEEDPNKHRQGSHDGRRNPHRGRGDRIDLEERSQPRVLPDGSTSRSLATRTDAQQQLVPSYVLQPGRSDRQGEALPIRGGRYPEGQHDPSGGARVSHPRTGHTVQSPQCGDSRHMSSSEKDATGDTEASSRQRRDNSAHREDADEEASSRRNKRTKDDRRDSGLHQGSSRPPGLSEHGVRDGVQVRDTHRHAHYSTSTERQDWLDEERDYFDAARRPSDSARRVDPRQASETRQVAPAQSSSRTNTLSRAAEDQKTRMSGAEVKALLLGWQNWAAAEGLELSLDAYMTDDILQKLGGNPIMRVKALENLRTYLKAQRRASQTKSDSR